MTREEAIETIRKNMPSDKSLPVYEAIQTLIPELAESEDEKIREDLIGGLMWQRDNLERLGKHDDSLILPGFCRTVGEHLAYLEKQKEQNAEWSTEDEKFAYFVNQFLGYHENADPTAMSCKKWFNNRLKSIKPQSKAEWSEGEKKMLAVISYKISQHQGNDERSLFTPDEAEFIDEMEEKLKSLRPSWKPSEQEKGALRTAIYVLTEERNFPKAAKQLQAILDAFDGKESRKDWKPSEEQMEALDKAIPMCMGVVGRDEVAPLESLYKQLKKLL